MPVVWIVIVNFRTAALVRDCLDSIAAQKSDAAKLRAVVVDNASGDGSVETLERFIAGAGYGDWVTIVPSARNGGFAAGNNEGIREALRDPPAPDYVMLLNPDTVAQDGAIDALVSHMERHPRAGIAGSQLLNRDGSTDVSAHRAPSPLGELEGAAKLRPLTSLLRGHAVSPASRRDAHRCDWVSGASLLVRSRVLSDVGMLDDGFFLYFEEVDYCTRARRAGWEVWHVPQSRVLHLEGASTGITEAARRRPAYWYASRRRYFVKHYGVLGLLGADLLWLLGRSLAALRSLATLGMHRAGPSPARLTRDLLLGDLAALLSGALRLIPREPRRSP